MKNGKCNRLLLNLSRITCSTLWVAITCWCGIMNILALLKIPEIDALSWLAEIAGYPAMLVYGLWMGIYLLMYILLGLWTAVAYRSWREWRYALVLQGALILLTMVVLTTFLKFDLLFRPVTLLLGGVELTGRVFSGNSIVYVFLDYFIAFVEIAVIQFIAIGCRWLVTRKLRKGKMAPEAMD